MTELAIELRSPISSDEFETLNRCLDEAIVQAVTEYARQRELSLSDCGTERLGFFPTSSGTCWGARSFLSRS